MATIRGTVMSLVDVVVLLIELVLGGLCAIAFLLCSNLLVNVLFKKISNNIVETLEIFFGHKKIIFLISFILILNILSSVATDYLQVKLTSIFSEGDDSDTSKGTNIDDTKDGVPTSSGLVPADNGESYNDEPSSATSVQEVTTDVQNTDEVTDKEESSGTIDDSYVIAPEIERNELNIDSIVSNQISFDSATIDVYQGCFYSEDQVDFYQFIAPTTGVYRIDLSDMYNDMSVDVYVSDSLDSTIGYDTYIKNGEGFTLSELEAGELYTIQVSVRDALNSYTLSLGIPKDTAIITGYTEIYDSIDYTDQVNKYYFEVFNEGTYRFDFSEVNAGIDFDIYLYNSLGEVLNYNSYCSNKEGITVNDLTPGEMYELRIIQKTGYNCYSLNIGIQKENKDISGFALVSDGIEYKDQCNSYTFIPTVDCLYYFEISGMMNDSLVSMYIYNHLGETIDYNSYPELFTAID